MIIGTGTIYYGKKNYRTSGNQETFDTTKWFVIFWLPIVPLGSYAIERKRRLDLIQAIAFTVSQETIYIHGRRPFDFLQVMRTFFKGWVSAVVLGWLVEYMVR